VNLKISGIISGTAFVLSLLIGLISGAGISAPVRALIFAAVFFVISGGAYWLILHFLPELFENPADDDPVMPQAGSLVDISLGDDSGEDLAEANVGEYISDGEAAPSGISLEDPSGLDQTDKISYTDDGMMGENPDVQEDGTGPVLSADIPDLPDELPDLESLSPVFSPGGGRRGGELSEFMISTDGLTGKKPRGNNKPGGLNDEFNPQDMASAVQTILKRE
jgi:hypothetical protein